MAHLADAYARMMIALLPPGKLWRTDPDSVLYNVFLGAGDELERIGGRSQTLLEESDPSTTLELLADYERVLLLDSTGTDGARQARIAAKLVQQQRFRPSDVLAALAPYLDLDVADIVMIEISNAEALATGHEEEIYRFYVYRDPLLAGTPDLVAAQLELDRISHSHTKGHVISSIGFICDDPDSLCDRDLLGV